MGNDFGLMLMTRRRKREYFILTLLACLGLALRWMRLDLMSFRFDSAEELFRARETLQSGFPPFTGIINSMGFRNPAAFTWILAPIVALTPDPRHAAAWIGLISMTGLWPMYRMSRFLLRGVVMWLPCVVYVVMPAHVFWGRSIWSLNLMPVVGAWALWAVLMTSCARIGNSRKLGFLLAGLAALCLGVLIHPSGAAWIIVASLYMTPVALRSRWPGSAVAGGLLILFVAMLFILPSLLDGFRVMRAPPKKPEYAAQYESKLPPPKNMAGRLPDAFGGLFEIFSSWGATGGIDQQIGAAAAIAGRLADVALLVLFLAGTVRALLTRKRKDWLLLAWCFLPPLVAAVVLSRPYGSYYSMALPAMLLLCACPLSRMGLAAGLRLTHVMNIVSMTVIWLCVLAYVWFLLACFAAVASSGYVHGPYYIPLKPQQQLAKGVADSGVKAGNFVHLSGEWFQRPYDYLLRHVYRVHESWAGMPMPYADGWGSRFQGAMAIAEDILLRGRQKARADYMENHATFRVGEVVVAVASDPLEARELIMGFWEIPAE
ncbi:MAG: hypothetical protein NTY46_14240 [Candidatus Sumerlaeota bacterium]|nr:hypothetical protein [Candidatus Sumerlaeota bacterium]